MTTPYVYELVNAWVQLGTKAPFNCVRIPVRNTGDGPEINLRDGIEDDKWVSFPQNGPRPKLDTWAGQPVAGIASDWV